MGELGEYFRDWREYRRSKHAKWNQQNTRIIGESGIPYLDRGETFCFREDGKPKVDFYPSTGRWRVVGTKETQKAMRGGARKFLGWYKAQSQKREKKPTELKDGDPRTTPDWDKGCDNCGAVPTVPLTGLCGPCTFGEAETAGGNW